MWTILAMLAAGQAGAPPAPSWMIGSWCTAPHRTIPGTICERWEAGPDGTLRGSGEVRRDGRTLSEERFEIRRSEGGYIFHAEPKGQSPADFRAGADDVAELAITFTNTTHDYPQRIRYWRDGEMLMAEIAMADGSRAVSWKYLPAK